MVKANYIIKSLTETYRGHGIRGLCLLISYWSLCVSSKTGAGNIQCPICGWTGNSFRPLLVMPLWLRKNAQCPNCLSLERHRTLFFFYKEYFENRHQLSGVMLHYAAEDCFKNYFRNIEGIEYKPIYYALEPMPVATRALRDDNKSSARIVGDLQSIEQRDNAISVLVSHHVLEHVADDRLALKEIHRVLRPKGACFINVPTLSPGNKTQQYQKPDGAGHYRIYGEDFSELCQETGFKVKIHYLKHPEEISAKYGLSNEVLFELTKI